MFDGAWPSWAVERIGLVSDSHGHAERTTRAVDALLADGADGIVHLGDVGDELVVDRLAGLPVSILLGNVDDRRLADYARSLDLMVHDPALVAEVGGIRFAATHGHREEVMASLYEASPDVLVHGHTHQCRDQTIGGVRFLNPGALYRTRVPMAAMLEVRSGVFSRYELPDDADLRRIPGQALGEPPWA